MKHILVALSLLLSLAPAWSADPDLSACTWPDGRAMPPKLCEGMRVHAAKRAAEAARAQALRDEADQSAAAEAAARRASEAQVAADRKIEEEKRHARWQVEDEERKQRLRDLQRQAEDEEAAQEQLIASRRKECGSDFANPRIGMSLARAQRCVGTFSKISETQSARGVMSTWRAGPIYLHVVGGSIVHWLRL